MSSAYSWTVEFGQKMASKISVLHLKFAKLKIPSLLIINFYGQHVLLDIYSTFLHCLIVVMFSVGIISFQNAKKWPRIKPFRSQFWGVFPRNADPWQSRTFSVVSVFLKLLPFTVVAVKRFRIFKTIAFHPCRSEEVVQDFQNCCLSPS